MKPEALKIVDELTDTINNQARKLAALRAQNAELLEALKLAYESLEKIERVTVHSYERGVAVEHLHSIHTAIQKASEQ